MYVGLYCSGWVKTGPVGVILTTMSSASETTEEIVEDYKQGSIIILDVALYPGISMFAWENSGRTVQSYLTNVNNILAACVTIRLIFHEFACNATEFHTAYIEFDDFEVLRQ